MEGDDEFTAFMAQGSPGLGRYAFLLTGDAGRAQDLTQETLIRVYEARRRIEPGGFSAYARRTMYNLSVSWWRRTRDRERPMPDGFTGPATADASGDYDERDAMLAAIRTLPVKTRTAIVLHYYEDLSTREIAEVLGSGEAAVRALLSRGRAQLAVRLTAAGPGGTDAAVTSPSAALKGAHR